MTAGTTGGTAKPLYTRGVSPRPLPTRAATSLDAAPTARPGAECALPSNSEDGCKAESCSRSHLARTGRMEAAGEAQT